jgi:uncharacterized tellurite resistance protein B-like protein
MATAQETLRATVFGAAPPTNTDPGVDLELPPGWTPLHSIALILFGASAVDGHVADIEVDVMLSQLVEYPTLDGQKAKVVLASAHAYAVRLMGERGLEGLMQGLSVHSAILANGYSEETLQVILSDVVHVIGADGMLDPAEHEYFLALKHQFGLG